MKKKVRRVLSLAMAAFLIASMAIVILGAEVSFNRKYVDSNTWTYTATDRKETKTDDAELKITQLLKADGSSSDYWRIYAKATSSGAKTYVEKGSYWDIPIPEDYREAGKSVSLYLMGHLPSLDCRASGHWVVH